MSNLLDGNSRFSLIPSANIERSQFDMSHTVKTSFNVGDLIPFDVIEVLPGDTFNIETNVLGRLQTLLTPIMDDLYLDVYWFFVPNRLVWSHWKNFMGENSENAWIPTTEYSVPQLRFRNNTLANKEAKLGSILDYLGVPYNAVGISEDWHYVNALPFRAYGLIYNEWFRDENLISPLLVDVGDTTTYWKSDDPVCGGMPCKVGKYRDYFTSALPSPQRGSDVTVPLTSDAFLPVFARNNEYHDKSDLSTMHFKGPNKAAGTYAANFYNTSSDLTGYRLTESTAVTSQSGNSAMYPDNLWTQVQGVPVATINQLRLAFATQRLYEKDARGGGRYISILKTHFGVDSPDSRLQRPELLSYYHKAINISQVVQSSDTGQGGTPLGSTAAMSVTGMSDKSFTKSFVEHGFVLGLCSLRYKHTYQQGLNKLWSRKSRFDYYWPTFAHIGEQPILNKEIYYSGASTDDEVFGYQEAYADYRYAPNRTSAFMRSGVQGSLDVWHLADNYKSLPALSKDWIQEDGSIIDRVLSVTSEAGVHQFYGDILVKNYATRPMPTYSVPGLIDHF